MVGLYTSLITHIFSNFDEFVWQQNCQNDFSKICWGTELKILAFQIFNSLSCLSTNILKITLTVTYFHQVYPSRLTLQRSSHLKTKLQECSVFNPSFHKDFSAISMASVSDFKYSTMSWSISCDWLPPSRSLCFVFGKIVKSRTQWKQERRLTMECFS